ncbi:MAG TPA: hypothetical protein VK432_09445 [Stellaceae bacterium]|nr:hypothetical protein [Stellaceae bacterium]
MIAKRKLPQRSALGLLLAAALAGAAWAQATGKFDGNYVGPLTLTGIINGDCTTPPTGSAYPLTIAGGVVHFKYVPRFDTVLVGKIDDKGDFKASGRTKSGMINMLGHVAPGGALTANIQSPSCLYSFAGSN